MKRNKGYSMERRHGYMDGLSLSTYLKVEGNTVIVHSYDLNIDGYNEIIAIYLVKSNYEES